MKLIKSLVSFALLVFALSIPVAAQDKEAGKTTKAKADNSGRVYMAGARGGCYYLTDGGKKKYVPKENCDGLANSSAASTDAAAAATTSSSTSTNNSSASGADKKAPAIETIENKSKERSEESIQNKTGAQGTSNPAESKEAAKSSADKETDSKTAAETETADAQETKTEPVKKNDSGSEGTNKGNGGGADRKYFKGSRGGCYYLTESGRKVYVKDKSLCGS